MGRWPFRPSACDDMDRGDALGPGPDGGREAGAPVGRDEVSSSAVPQLDAGDPLAFVYRGVLFRLLPGADRPCPTSPERVVCAASFRLGASLVPCGRLPEQMRVAHAHAAVLDGLLTDADRRALLEQLVGEVSARALERDALEAHDRPSEGPLEPAAVPLEAPVPLLPPAFWSRRTADAAGGSGTWGGRTALLDSLLAGTAVCLQSLGERLAGLFPDYLVAHLPTDALAPSGDEGDEAGALHPFVVNASMAGDSYAWHVDADPTSFHASSAWSRAFGDYVNGEPGLPLLASLVVYPNPRWEPGWGGDTHLLDPDTGCGALVVPRPGRALLMDQDALHRVSAPLAGAGGRPRFSVVWKLALVPRRGDAATAPHDIFRPGWDPPALIGSAARVEAIRRAAARQVLAKRRRGEEHP